MPIKNINFIIAQKLFSRSYSPKKTSSLVLFVYRVLVKFFCCARFSFLLSKSKSQQRKNETIFRFRCLFTYQIPLICEIRIGGIFVLLGCYRDGCGWVDGRRQRFLVAALEPTEIYLLYGAVNLRKQMLNKMRIKCTIWKHFQLFIEKWRDDPSCIRVKTAYIHLFKVLWPFHTNVYTVWQVNCCLLVREKACNPESISALSHHYEIPFFSTESEIRSAVVLCL